VQSSQVVSAWLPAAMQNNKTIIDRCLSMVFPRHLWFKMKRV
jgi:hypothetical protein